MIGELNTHNPELFLVAGDLIRGRWVLTNRAMTARRQGRKKPFIMNVMKQPFGGNMVDTVGLPAQVNGDDARPFGTLFESDSYAYQHNSLLVIAIDVFKQDDPNTNIHALFDTVSTEKRRR